MNNQTRRWFSLVNLSVQFRVLFMLIGAIFSITILLGSFVYLTLKLIHVLPIDPAVQTHFQSILWNYGLSVFGAILVASSIFCLVALRETNRIVGPIYRVKEELKRMHENGNLRTVSVRERDHFQEMVKYLNLVITDQLSEESDADE